MTTPNKLRIGIIGAGGIFRSLHQPYYQMTTRAHIVAVSDVREEAAREVAAVFGAEACADYHALLARDDVDAVDICAHPNPHCEITLAAAQAGKHVLIEKPMCRTVAEADAMIAACKQAGVVLQVAYMLRFNPTHQKLKQLLDDGVLGDVHLVYANQVGWFPPRHPWLFVREESGGMLVEQAIHTLDEWLWLYGAVSSVYARTSQVAVGGTYPELERAVENNATVVVNFASGATGMLCKSWAAEVGHHGAGVIGSKGSANISEGALRWKTHDMNEAETFKPDAPDDDTYRTVSPEARAKRYWSYASKGASIEHWLKGIAGEETPTTGGEVGRAGIEIAEAAYRSAQTGQVVRLPL